MLSSRKKSCYFKRNNIQEIDYKDVKLLTKFINDQGKITPRRAVSYTHLRAHETRHDLVCRLLLEKKK